MEVNNTKNEKDKVSLVEGDIATVIQVDGILHRFHRTEVKPVFFGKKSDCGTLLIAFGASWTFYHAIYLFFWSIEKRIPFGEIWSGYFSDKIMMTGMLMTCWFVGYNLASWAIWANFEYRLERDAPPDDFEFVCAGESFDTGLGPIDDDNSKVVDPKMSKMASQTLLVTMPSGELVIGTNTRSQSAASMLIMNNTGVTDTTNTNANDKEDK